MPRGSKKTVAKKKDDSLDVNLNQERFCQLYATDREFFGNGVETYLEVYDINRKNPNWYQVACSAASRLLSNVKVIERINQILAETGFNDAAVDKQLSFLITQHADFQSKLGAIKEYNKLKKRIQDRLDLTNNGKDLPTPIMAYVSSNDRNSESKGDEKKNPSGSRGNVSQQNSVDHPILNSLGSVGHNADTDEHSE